jgi:hypothetical protein
MFSTVELIDTAEAAIASMASAVNSASALGRHQRHIA